MKWVTFWGTQIKNVLYIIITIYSIQNQKIFENIW
jgi:hypothetical protein